ncbi:hypothetical protein Dsin_016710 [Dipteronia sinensis]|uniref:Uncharacterized protein n=1 Tax=Dipteronia sinensis TaxID=43782 RepID=A0AAE0ADP8_9ROSI|nr:hypothetical protein Dsin_016710 [Dipteronia sinensis]
MSSSNTSQTLPYFGSSTELFNPNCSATVILIDYDEKREIKFLRYGGFLVNMIIQSLGPVMMITCTVDGLQWPISKDAPIIRVGQRCFTFGMPGLLYGLRFPQHCEVEKIDTLEMVLMRFGHYDDLDVGKLTGYPWKDDDPNIWYKLLPMIKIIVHNTLSQFGHHPGKSPSAVGDQESSKLKVDRTSAFTKMVGDAILSGSLKPNHIDIQDMKPKQKCGDSGISATNSEQAFASISLFTNLVEALELFWVIAHGKSHLLKEKNTNLKELVGFKMWRLNQLGIAAFMKKLSSQSNLLSQLALIRRKSTESTHSLNLHQLIFCNLGSKSATICYSIGFSIDGVVILHPSPPTSSPRRRRSRFEFVRFCPGFVAIMDAKIAKRRRIQSPKNPSYDVGGGERLVSSMPRMEEANSL